MSTSDWFAPHPLEYYASIGQQSAVNVPDSPPASVPFGSPPVDVKVGPIIRLLATHERQDGKPLNNYRATAMLVTNDSTTENPGTPPTIDFSVGPASNTTNTTPTINSGSFPGTQFFATNGLSFWRYNIDIQLNSVEQKVVYSVNGVNKPQYHFYIPSLTQSMNVVSFSCNGFSLATDTSEYKNSLWYDVLEKHGKLHYHVAIGGGDQLYCDKVKLVSQDFQDWLEESNPLKKMKAPFNDDLKNSLDQFYLQNYTDWFGSGHWSGSQGKTLQALFPVALSTIPTANIYDDHDVIDGYGTYKHETMDAPVFKGLGKVAFKYYMIFQHHTAPHEQPQLNEPSWIFGAQPGPYMEELSHSNYIRLGKEIAYVGFDCRTERKRDQILTYATYNEIFARLESEIKAANGDIKHLLILLGVPIAYPRLVWLEKILTSRALAPVRMLAQKRIVSKGLVNEFDGSIEVLDDLEDHWCAKHHKHERNYLVGKLQEFGAANGVRITILSGDVHLAAVGRFKSKIHKHSMISKRIEANEHVLTHPEQDPRLILNVISSAITNAPPPNGMATLLYKRSKIHRFDRNTDEDMVRLFHKDVDGEDRDNNMFLNKRNWSDLVLVKQDPYYSSGNAANVSAGDTNDAKQYIAGRYPGLVTPGSDLGGNVLHNTLDKVAYPVMPDSLVASIHVERHSEIVNEECARYEVLVPPMVGEYQLKDVGVKN
ncbi:hypothetical protein DASC09_060660 [Saccharomycopsis crataegensis]|uniref:PhoD-like phosphatase domain-containing protein n=1 Tax=Saccharomycopsis crataegensis TaxID=43959 RepID=A0AAV5QUZ6_9ASCO|nr:hypothetical protein DASC09_060660 [Saccharomycopsis crataegensis]